MGYAHNGTTWSFIKNVSAKDPLDSTWKDADFWVKISGTWRQMVPPNAIILYTANPSRGQLCNGANGTTNLHERAPSCAGSSFLTLAGSATHAGSDHPNSATTLSSYSNSKNDYYAFNSQLTVHHDYHNHAVAAHDHPDSASNTPTHYSYFPYQYTDKIMANAVILGRASLTHASIAQFTAGLNAYIRLSTTGVGFTAGNVSHTHGTKVMNSAWETYNTLESKKADSSGSWTTTHYHNLDHVAHSNPPYFAYRTVTPYLVSSAMFFDELPSDAVVLFTTSHLPDGWTQIAADDRLLLGNTTPNTTNAASQPHDHRDTRTSGGKLGGTSEPGQVGTNALATYITPPHTHTFTDDHEDYIVTPKIAKFNVAYKN